MQQAHAMDVKKVLVGCVVGAVSCVVSTAQAATVGYWNFEQGLSDGEAVLHEGPDGTYNPDVFDVSGNENHLSVWSTGGGAGYAFRTNVPSTPLNSGTNNFSVKNTGGGPAIWTNTLQDWAPTAWTIEVSFKVEAGGYRTFVGRDSQGGVVNGGDLNVAALYLQKQDDESLAIKFLDATGTWHEAETSADFIQGFDFNVDPEGNTAPWYSAAAVSDGSTLSLWLMNHGDANPHYQLVAQTDLTASGSANTALSTGHGDGGDWDAGDFSFGRGLHGGGHVDRAYGYLDEIRFSDVALTPDQFLFVSVPEPASLVLLGLGGLSVMSRRRD